MTWINVSNKSAPYVTIHKHSSTYTFYFNPIASQMASELIIDNTGNESLDILVDPSRLQVSFSKGEGYRTRFKGNDNCLEVSAGKALSVLGLRKTEKDLLRGIRIPLKVNDRGMDYGGVLYVDLSNYIQIIGRGNRET